MASAVQQVSTLEKAASVSEEVVNGVMMESEAQSSLLNENVMGSEIVL
jgi:hypothetical protein